MSLLETPRKLNHSQAASHLRRSQNPMLQEPNEVGISRLTFQNFCAESLEQRRLFLVVPFAIIAGILTWISLPSTPDLMLLVSLMAAAGLAAFLSRRSLVRFVLFALVAAFFAGQSLIGAHGVLHGTRMLDRATYGEFTFTIADILRTGSGERLVISNIRNDENAQQLEIKRARIVGNGETLRVGDEVSARLRLYPVPSPVLRTAFDSQFQSYFDGIGAYGSLLGDHHLVARSTDANNIMAQFASLRAFISSRINQAVSGDAAAILMAVIVGDQSQITDELRQTMADAGLAHVLAISGLHLSLIAGGIFAAVRWLCSTNYFIATRYDVKYPAAILGAIVAMIYLGLSGASVSAIRATIMILLVFGAVLAGRKALTLRNVAIAALLVLIIDPASLMRASFQLSFAAVVALVGFYESFSARKSEHAGLAKKSFGYVIGLSLTSLIAGLATAPFAAYHFQNVAPLGVLGNAFALPLVGFVMLPAAFLSVVLMPLGLETKLLEVSAWSVDAILYVATTISNLGNDFVSVPLISQTGLMIMLATLCIFAVIPNWWRTLAPAIGLSMIAIFGLNTPPDLLIADGTKAIAIRDGDAYGLVSGRAGSFTTDVWSESFQLPIHQAIPQSAYCDPLGCVTQKNTSSDYVALPFTPDALNEDCRDAKYIITRLYIPSWCAKSDGRRIDFSDLQTHGGHALWFGQSEIISVPAIPNPNREWRPNGSR